MGAIASQITSLAIVYSIVYSDADQRKHQSSASLAFVRVMHRGPVNSPHKWPVTWRMFPFDDVIMLWNIPAYLGTKYFSMSYADVRREGNHCERHRRTVIEFEIYHLKEPKQWIVTVKPLTQVGPQVSKQQVLELMQMHPKERLRRVILIASRYSTGLKLENYYFFTFIFSWPEVGKLFHIYFFFTFSFSWPEVGKLFHIYFFTFSQTEVGKLFCSYVFTFSRPEVGKLFHISMAKCKTAVTPLLIHWSYCSLALSHQNME